MELKLILAVAIGSAIGGVLRFVIGWTFVQWFGPGFPYGTLFINISGSFLIGVVAELAATRAFGITPLIRVFFATGALGGYTTFSTFSLDAITLINEGATLSTMLYAGASVCLSFLATYGGQVVARIAIR